MTPKEFRQNAEDCLKLARQTDQIFAKAALIEMAKEFRAMAEHLERNAIRRRTANGIRRRVASFLRARLIGSR
jgi:hypothetical protein